MVLHRFFVPLAWWLLILTSSIHEKRVAACTDILVTPGASQDGSSFIAYNADSPTLYGVLYHYPATTGANNSQNDDTDSSEQTMINIYDWDSGAYRGEIPAVYPTYNVVGNSNEHGLIIGETTFGGVSVLAWNQTGAIMDYGSLIYVTLQRAQTAREAIKIMADLVDAYGYGSGGESFSLADRTGEVWMMEMISRGSEYKNGTMGAVWVAVRIPDGAVAAHANQARITTFPRDDPENCLYAPDVVDVAVYYGLYSDETDPDLFSFSDVYDPINFVSVRQGEARVWSIFSAIADSNDIFRSDYQAYAMGEDLQRRMPLFVFPFRKLSLLDVMSLMNSHYENTQLDSSVDVGAGLFECPYRPRPLVWSYNNTSYHNERSIATPKTGWNFIGQIRPWMPRELSSLVWFACDDSSTSPRVPVYSSSTRIAAPYAGQGSQDGVVTPLLKFDFNKAFWIQNMVSNFAYYRWADVYPVLRSKIDKLEADFVQQVTLVDQRALKAYQEQGSDAAVAYVTLYSVNAGQRLHSEWTNFYGELFVRFRDFYTIVSEADDPLCACRSIEPGLSESTKRRIIEETGDHYRVLHKPPTLLQEKGVVTIPGEGAKENRPNPPIRLETDISRE